jgi:hypothetical protein
MQWKNLFRKKQTATEHLPTVTIAPTPKHVVGKPPARVPMTSDDPAARERKRARLERRVADLRYDLTLAESDTRPENRWTERAAELDAAIAQARSDAEATLAAPPEFVGVPLPPLPVTVERVTLAEPAEIAFRVGDECFRYTEEVDWAERGHQKVEPVLRRVDGSVDALLPADLPAERRGKLHEHLAHGLGTLAALLRECGMSTQDAARKTLADLASPCPACGGWRDLLGRCPACQQRQWAADALRADAERLRKERDDQLEEAHRWAERLPILRRQLLDAEAELAQLGG